MNRRLLLASLAGALWLAGCATSPRPGASTAAGGAPAVSLADEHRRLAELFRGTPVVIGMTPQGSLHVEVPLKYAFDKGRAVVKPPLAKVLDHLVPSARSLGMAARLGAPADAGGDAPLARERAASARDYLVAKGVPATHFSALGAAPADAVEIVVGRP